MLTRMRLLTRWSALLLLLAVLAILTVSIVHGGAGSLGVPGGAPQVASRGPSAGLPADPPRTERTIPPQPARSARRSSARRTVLSPPADLQTFGRLAAGAKQLIRRDLIGMLESAHANYESAIETARLSEQRRAAALQFRERLAIYRAELRLLEHDGYWTIDPADHDRIFGECVRRFPGVRFFLFGTGYLTPTGRVVSVVFPVSVSANPELIRIDAERALHRRRELSERVQRFNAMPRSWRRARIEHRSRVIEEIRKLAPRKNRSPEENRRLAELYADEVLKLIPRGTIIDKKEWKLKQRTANRR